MQARSQFHSCGIKLIIIATLLSPFSACCQEQAVTRLMTWNSLSAEPDPLVRLGGAPYRPAQNRDGVILRFVEVPG